ncbi:PDZ domain-containing protein [Pelagicoccus sp. SDUM812005]|uniref:M61 family metallopeptidase n=1 Tax=Pelagicoccus sp. SDUM812005 TaxID=3041257 RepID=UPI00280F6AB6|nr:PDZ domain-containing protein [Pelagicoccus sp. SDUM812005]MDQ8183676.1 PDZ domain-containing protein [Pelagicoccus sp. SDUM812005]
MLRLPFLLLLFLALASPLILKAERPAIAYTLSFSDARNHYLDVEMRIPAEGKRELELFMPVWTPGSYLVREYARNIISLEAADGSGKPLQAQKTSKNRWRVDLRGSDTLVVNYRLFSREINVRSNWVESDFAVINGAPTYLSVVDDYQRPYEVQVELPEGWKRSCSPLPAGKEPNSYRSPDFDTLVDSPMVVGTPEVDRFEVDGVEHYLVTLGGGGVWDNERAARNVQHLVETQRDFWESLPYSEPYYFFNLLTGSRGGLEHRQSLVMTADRWYSKNRGGIRSWLSLVSHEFFHAWNGKRLRPVELGPFEYEHENYCSSLWVVEGITSYYQHVLLARAGYNTVDQYLGALSGSIAGTQRTPGRMVQSLSDSSFDAWIKAYRRDENSVNALFSYYSGGAVAGFLIDAEIQRASEGKASLDDVLRLAYERYSGEHGYSEDEFIALAGEVAGKDLSAWFEQLVREPGEFDYQPALDWYGLEFEAPKASTNSGYFPVEEEPADLPRGWLGASTSESGGILKVTSVPAGTSASEAGLYVDDEIIAIDRNRVDAKQLNRIVGLLGVGAEIDLLVSRQGLLRTLKVELGEEPSETWRLRVRSDQSEAQAARVARWLGSPDQARE